MATINDVAKESGLSVGTVSRYLNGAKLKQANNDAIETAIVKLDYRSNSLAKSMKTGRSMMVAIIVPGLSNIFSMRVIESIERVLEEKGYSVLISDCGGRIENEYRKLSLMCSKMVDGVVLMPTGQDSTKIQQIVRNTPVVLIDRTMDKPVFDSVTIDNRGASYRLVKSVLEKGIRKIGIIEGPQSLLTARERSKGYNQALKEFGIEPNYRNQGGYTVESGYRAITSWLDEGMEAVFASNYELTIGAMNALYDYKRQMRVVGFDNLELAYFTNQTYDYISQPVEEIGEKAAKLLLERIKNPEKDITSIVLQP